MSQIYNAVGWNRQKKVYDLALVAGVVAFVAAFVSVGFVTHPEATAETQLIRGIGLASFVLLHVVLSIGPLCRLDRRFLPLLYNRRHMGVTMFVLALAHGAFALFQFHALGNVNPLVSLFTSNTHYASLPLFPFQTLGFAALVVLFLMAATSHDFWLANLTAPVWKVLHMGVYFAYALLVAHVALGSMQAPTGPVVPALVGAGLAWIVGIHLLAGFREAKGDREPVRAPGDFVDACAVREIPENRARVVLVRGERVAVFRAGGRVFALSGACQHQNGPLGEGCVRDGLVTCPWHGYQYEPETGASPPPFTERVPTFDVRIVEGRVEVRNRPNPLGAEARAATWSDPGAADETPFFIGYLPSMPAALARFIRPRIAAVLLGAAVLAGALAATQEYFGPGVFEFGTVREYEGVVSESPVPTLLLRRPGTVPAHGTWSRFLLVAQGKHGAGHEIAGLDGRPVRLSGTLVHRDGRMMIEIATGSVTEAGVRAPASATGPQDLGTFSLRGEIVDSKCYLGVMKPGNGKPHRSCAIRCILGGIPPVLAVREPDGTAQYLVLVGDDGKPINEAIVDRVADPVEVRGRVERRDDLLILHASPEAIRRIS